MNLEISGSCFFQDATRNLPVTDDGYHKRSIKNLHKPDPRLIYTPVEYQPVRSTSRLIEDRVFNTT